MARRSDHVQRRAQIVSAVLSIALDSGLSTVTIARVASVARISVGLVQHYFTSKDSLLQASYDACLDTVGSRVEEIIESGEHRRLAIREMISDGLSQLLPLDPGREAECRLRQEFLGLAAGSAELSATASARDAELILQVKTAVENGKECGEVRQDQDSSEAADLLIALCHGVMMRSIVGSTVDTDTLESAVNTIFSGECDRQRPR